QRHQSLPERPHSRRGRAIVTKDRSVYIRHIYDCICWIKEYVQAGKEAFFQDRKTQDAVIRNLEVIGQAVKDLGTDSLTSSHPETPWPQIAATRNFLAHQYFRCGFDADLEHRRTALAATGTANHRNSKE
ncbi:MAG: DUF86 domain-containing protein, partial [Sulfuricella sp.]|nr:DUF86 domain-containing protein [Sulfuricella sp.]